MVFTNVELEMWLRESDYLAGKEERKTDEELRKLAGKVVRRLVGTRALKKLFNWNKRIRVYEIMDMDRALGILYQYELEIKRRYLDEYGCEGWEVSTEYGDNIIYTKRCNDE